MDAFKTFFFRYYREYLSFSARFLQDQGAARTVTLEAFFLLWDRYAEFDSETRIRTFLYLSIRNKCMQAVDTAVDTAVDPPLDSAVIPASLPADILRDILAFAGTG